MQSAALSRRVHDLCATRIVEMYFLSLSMLISQTCRTVYAENSSGKVCLVFLCFRFVGILDSLASMARLPLLA